MARKRTCSNNPGSTRPQWASVEQLEARLLLSATDSLPAAASAIMTPTMEVQAMGPSDTITAQPYYTPSQICAAYGFNNIMFTNSKGQKVAGNGTGQTIAIIDAYEDANITSDLQAFDANFGISNNDGQGRLALTVAMMAPASKMTTDTGWSLETSLDVEWAHAVAPGAHILLVEAASASISDLLAAVTYATNQTGVVAVSMSWGGGEMSSEKYFDPYFTTPASHRGGSSLLGGITFIAAAGDNGAGAEWPSVSPNVVAVGGTTLSTTSSDGWGAESAWSDGGGGVSVYEPKPSYQNFNTLGGSYRTNPDVSYDANPSTGYLVYDTAGYSGWLTVGGTSAGAPQWAGLIAIADQGRALKGKGSLYSAVQTLPDLYSLSPNDFHDIITGSDGSPATTGYDLATGRGSPKANMIALDLVTINAMAFPKVAATSVTVLAAKMGYNADMGGAQSADPAPPAQEPAPSVIDAAPAQSQGEPAAAAATVSSWASAEAAQSQLSSPQDSAMALAETASGQDQTAPMADSALSIAGRVLDPLDAWGPAIT